MRVTIKEVSYENFHSEKVRFFIKMSFEDIRLNLKHTHTRKLKIRTVSEQYVDEHRSTIDLAFATVARETGSIIERLLSYEEAEQRIEEYEYDDKRDGYYSEDFYEILDFFGMNL